MYFRADTIDRPAKSRAQRLAFALIGVAAVAVTIAWRWAALHAHWDPVGVDIGNWLTFGHAILSGHFSPGGAVYPPLVPALVRIVDAVIGMPTTAHVVAAAAGVGPAIGAWVATRSSLPRPWPAAAGVALAVAGATSAAVAWGGIPQLLGLGVAPVAVVAASRFALAPGRRRALAVGALVTLVGAISPLVFALTALTAVLALGIATALHGSARWARSALWALAPPVVLTPLYWRFVTTASVERHAGAGGGAHRILSTVFLGGTIWWVVLGGVALVTPAVTWSHRFEPLWTASAAMSVVGAGSLIAAISWDPRFACLLPTAVAVAVATAGGWSQRVAQPLVAVVAGIALIGIVAAAPATMSAQRDTYARLVPVGTGAAVAWVRAHTNNRALVAVTPVSGAPLGWLVEGWAGRASLVGSDPTWLVFPDERTRAGQATSIFTDPHWPSPASFARARALGVRWLYVATGWGGVDPAALDRAEQQHPGLVAYRGRGAMVLTVPGGATGR